MTDTDNPRPDMDGTWMLDAHGYWRGVLWRPGFHRCDPNPSRNYGISGITVTFVLVRHRTGVTWDLLTTMDMPPEDFVEACPDCDHPMHQGGPPGMRRPVPGGLSIHRPRRSVGLAVPSLCTDDCLITGGPCEVGASFVVGDHLYRLLSVEGEDAMWDALRGWVRPEVEEVRDG